jgi:hypothetical protein
MPWAEKSAWTGCHPLPLKSAARTAVMAHELDVWLFTDRIGILTLIAGQ